MSPTSQKLESISDRKAARSVLLCGASVRSLAESAIAAGLRPLCVDFFEDADLKDLLSSGRGRFVGRLDSFDQLPQVIRSVRKSIPLLWAGGLENHTDVLREVSRSRPVIGIVPAIIEQLRDPVTLQSWLSDAAIDSPRLATENTADATCSWLRKSVASSGGLGIGRHAHVGRTEAAVSAGTAQTGFHITPAGSRDEIIDKADVPASRRFARSGLHPPDVYLQEYIDGVPMSATFCANESELELFGMSLQLIGWPCLGATDFLFCGNIGPVDPGDKVRKQVLEIARVLADRSGIRGVFGIDFVLRQGRVWLLEVNPRLTASHMLYELQHPGLLVHRHLGAFGWTSKRPQRSRKSPMSGVLKTPPAVSLRLIFWAREDVCIEGQFAANQSTDTFRFADCPQPGTVVGKSSPLCSLHIFACDLPSIERILIDFKYGHPEGTSSFDEPAGMGIGTKAVAGQLRLLRKRFQWNCG